jgi:hypothetical protein
MEVSELAGFLRSAHDNLIMRAVSGRQAYPCQYPSHFHFTLYRSTKGVT